MLVYNMVHIFAWVNEWFLSFCAALAHVVSCTSSWFVWLTSTAEFQSPNPSKFFFGLPHNVMGIWEGQSKIVLLFFSLSPSEFKALYGFVMV